MRFSDPNNSNTKSTLVRGLSLLTLALAISAIPAVAEDTEEMELLGDKSKKFEVCKPQEISIPGVPLRWGLTIEDMPVEYHAEVIETLDKDTVKLSGDAMILQGQSSIAATNLTFQRDTNVVTAEGEVTAHTSAGDQFIADKGNIHIQSLVGDMETVQYKLADREKIHQDPSKAYIYARGESEKVYMQGLELITMENATYTTCEEGNRDVVITAKELVLDQVTGIGTASSAVIRFKNVPIFYWPRLSFPIGDKRKSGFLFPGVWYDKNSGYQLDLPYYWNIAPQYDATITPRYYSRRGGQLGLEFRYLGENHEGLMAGQYMPDDDKYGDSRSAFLYEHDQDFNEQWDAEILLQYVSDEDYLDDLANDINISSSTYLQEKVATNYVSDNWDFSASLLDYQAVDSSIADADKPYKRLPEILFASNYEPLPSGIELGIEGSIVDFDEEKRTTGTRADLTPYISFPIERTFGFLEPRLDMQFTSYDLSNQPARDPDSPTRAIPTLSIDSGLFFDRKASWGGSSFYDQTLEPRLKYVYTPFEAQDDLPNFDTGYANLENFGLIFKNNRFFGPDRVGDTNKLIFALTSRYIEIESGSEPLLFSLGQIYFLENRRVGLDGPVKLDDSLSDFLAELEVDLTKNFRAYSYVQIDDDFALVEEGKFDLEYNPYKERSASLQYRFTRDSSEQAIIRADWALNPRWSVLFNNNYDMRDDENLATQIGLTYDGCCWGVSAVAQRRFDRNSDERDSFVLVFKLTDFGEVRSRF